MKTFKVVLLGKTSVGKTSFVTRLTRNKFNNYAVSTIGASFFAFHPQKYNKEIKLDIWDTSGQERYRSLGPMYYRHARIILLLYDVTDRDSFDNVDIWLKEVIKYTDNQPYIVLIGTKTDLADRRKINIDEAFTYAKNNNITYYETSALTGYGISNTIDKIIDKVLTLPEEKTQLDEKLIDVADNTRSNRYCSCY